tara:strand:+ start:792 stop:1316 length:525 start_codon:yes stop_codon:yes gene_type:complete
LIFRNFLILNLVFFFNSGVFAVNIRVLDFQKIIENNNNLSLFYDQIKEDQESYKNEFKTEELNLQNEYKRIEELNLILDPNELDNEIEKYNIKLNDFNSKIQKFNLHYETQINNFKNQIINITLEILKQYSDANKIDLVLDSNNYVLSSNSINITELIEDKVNNIKIEINIEKY